jgi:regulatory protein YycH of two-component signal transduction system YycFG
MTVFMDTEVATPMMDASRKNISKFKLEREFAMLLRILHSMLTSSKATHLTTPIVIASSLRTALTAQLLFQDRSLQVQSYQSPQSPLFATIPAKISKLFTLLFKT